MGKVSLITEKKYTVLLVDDDSDTLNTVNDLSKHFNIISAVDLGKVMQILYQKDIDLVLLDMAIPKITGFDLCKLLKQNENTKHIPIVFLTDKPNFVDIRQGFDLGAIDYIVKPFSKKEFLIRITNHLELNSYRTELEKKVEQTLNEYQKAEKLLLQQAKQAEIGELMMHIAHQWKQPLSELGSINNYLQAKLELNQTITQEEYSEVLQNNAQIIAFMSQTMSTFQNFYKPDEHTQKFFLNEAISAAFGLVSATFDYYDIGYSYKSDVDEACAFGSKNEFSQTVLAILINAKDIFLKRITENPKIEITLKSRNGNYIVTIQDNGGGVQEDLVENIFDPFISENSTGMGLFMVKSICEKNNWNIAAENKNGGALFSIIIKKEEIC